MNKYSIVLPVHNGGEYVKQCVSSILNQTCGNFNLHILENKSNDGTREWLDTIKDERVIILPSDKLLSIEDNWARIKDISKNEFITLIGHDDILCPNYLETMEALINKHPNASLYQTHFNFIDAEGNSIKDCKKMEMQYDGAAFLQAVLKQQIDITGTGYMMRAKDYDAVGGIPVNYPKLLFSDFEMWIKETLLSYQAISEEKCFSFRLHNNTSQTQSDRYFHESFHIFIHFLKTLQANSILNDIIVANGGQFLEHYAKSYSHKLLRSKILERDYVKVSDWLAQVSVAANELSVLEYHPEKIQSIKIAEILDSNRLLRSLFLLWKRIIKKPILKE